MQEREREQEQEQVDLRFGTAGSAMLRTVLFAARRASSRSFASRMLAAFTASKSSTATW
ncbi:MAG: hypothetical protein KF795_03750 [Labilithrix sp.]|nr:hypothetical protein [Labilithrix sp.]